MAANVRHMWVTCRQCRLIVGSDADSSISRSVPLKIDIRIAKEGKHFLTLIWYLYTVIHSRLGSCWVKDGKWYIYIITYVMFVVCCIPDSCTWNVVRAHTKCGMLRHLATLWLVHVHSNSQSKNSTTLWNNGCILFTLSHTKRDTAGI